MDGGFNAWQLRIAACAAIGVFMACSSEPPAPRDTKTTLVGTGGTAPVNGGQSGTGGAVSGSGTGGGGGKGAPAIGGTGGASGAGGADSNAGSGGKPSGGSGAGGGGSTVIPSGGMLDGDPSKPMVSIPDVACGVPNAGFGQSPATVKITNRDVVVAYPCAHEGADVTFFLFLHGTLGDAQKVQFTMSAFPIHRHVDSHNVIVVVPKAVNNQWGNGTGGETDMPHLYDVVDWVYDTFGEKFNIRTMWASGGSWGAAYLGSKFACDPMFQDRLTGVRMIVGGGCPACASRLSCIVGQQELDAPQGEAGLTDAEEEMRGSMYFDTVAAGHGCDAKTGPTMLGPVKQWTWANCDPGWVHSYYLAPGPHAESWDYPGDVVLKMTEEIKSIEK